VGCREPAKKILWNAARDARERHLRAVYASGRKAIRLKARRVNRYGFNSSALGAAFFTCGAAGAPCPACNSSTPDEPPRLPNGFEPDA
jgi:hypothetical protein